MPRIERNATVTWEGTLSRGTGKITAGTGAFKDLDYSLPIRIGNGSEGKTSPEELLAAAHAGCLATGIAGELSRAQTPPEHLDVTANVVMDEVEGKGHVIVESQVRVRARVPASTRPRSPRRSRKRTKAARSRCSFARPRRSRSTRNWRTEMNSSAQVTWTGDLSHGSGEIHEVPSGAFGPLQVSWASRTEEPGGKTSPEELIAAAHASCYAMQFSSLLAKAGSPPDQLNTSATVTFEVGKGITKSALTVTGRVPGLDEGAFKALAEEAKETCPVSVALKNNVELTLDARLQS